MALAQQKLAIQVQLLRNKLDKLLVAVNEVFDEGDGIDWRKKTDNGQ